MSETAPGCHPPIAPPAAGGREAAAEIRLRWLLIAAQAATLWITWPLWQVRTQPPPLPLLPLPQFDMGVPLLACLAAIGLRPRVGTAAYAATLAWAVVTDQLRLQPYMLSLLLLTLGTTGHPAGVLAARTTLVATWLYAGLHKLTSAGFFADTAPWLVGGLWPALTATWSVPIGATIAAGEVLLAVGCLVPRCRIAAAVVAAAAHAATLVALSPLGLDWNPAVWPWNATFACVAPMLLLTWRGPGLGDAWAQAAPWARAASAALLVMPAGYWLGVTDASLAHCLYAGNVPRAFICTPFSRVDINTRIARLNVFVPPAQRLFDPLFLGVGRAGEWMEVEDPRWIAARSGWARRQVRWNDLAPAPVVAPPTRSPVADP
jgi:hypothetical protein